MTILYLCNEYPPGKIGGIGSMTRTLARAMVSAGHTVLVAGLYLPGYGGADHETDQEVKVWRKRLWVDIGLIKNNYSVLDTVLLKSLTASGILEKDLLKNIGKFNRFIEKLIDEFKVDIIEWPDFNDWFQYLNSPLHWPELSVPVIVKFHGTQTFLNYPAQQPANNKLYILEKDHITRAAALAAVCRHTAESYKRLYKLDKPITILYNSIELPPMIYRADQAQAKIIFTGALTERKGLFSLIKAWNILHKKHPDAVLEIFGKGKINTFLKEALPEARHSIRYMGFRTKEEFYQSMSSATAAIFPSYSECFAFAPLEAMAAGCPVINTERFSGPELITHGENGLLINPDDPAQMAESMSSLLLSEPLRNKFSVNGRRTVKEHFSIDQSITDHLRFYEQVIRQFQQKAIPA
jgi:glycosyltransferase involved in cell wall biosynthesis